MIEFNFSIVINGSLSIKNSIALSSPDDLLIFIGNSSLDQVERIELRNEFKDCTLEDGLKFFLDACKSIELSNVEATLKVEAYISPSEVAALNFEISHKMLRHLTEIGVKLDLWVMPIS